MSRLAGIIDKKKYYILAAAVVVLLGAYLVNTKLLGKVESPGAYFFYFLMTAVVLFAVLPVFRPGRLTAYYWGRTRKNLLAKLGLWFIVFLAVVALIGPLFTPDAAEVNFPDKNLPPVGFPFEQSTYDPATGKATIQEVYGTWKHPLGTDDKGRDLLAMLISGIRVSLIVGLSGTAIAVFLGTVIGVTSAYLGGWADNVIMRFTDIMMTFPWFLLLLLIIYLYGSSLALIILVAGLTGWTGIARLVRSESLSLRTREFVMAARALGASHARIIFRHLVPNTVSQIIVVATLSIPGFILAESGLSFLKLGDPSVISWGQILSAGQQTLDTAWWTAVEPGIMLFLTILAFNYFGDAVRDAFDPRSNV
ncbi:MAG: ABC transporter permease [Chloroflexi bacterium]|nr:ABC transporter permease [Chloroflexota bacterium]